METQSINEEKRLVDNVDLERENENNSVWLEKKSFRIAIVSRFSTVAIVLGYMLAPFPNIELFTLIIFLSGFTLGRREGMIVGFLSSLIFCFYNPYGASPLPLFAFQLTHYTLTGLIGAFTNEFLRKRSFFAVDKDLYIFPVMLILGTLGAIITTNYQVFVSLVSVLYTGTIEEFLPYFITGIPFTLIHIIGNTLGFIFILPGLIQIVHKMLD